MVTQVATLTPSGLSKEPPRSKGLLHGRARAICGRESEVSPCLDTEDKASLRFLPLPGRDRPGGPCESAITGLVNRGPVDSRSVC